MPEGPQQQQQGWTALHGKPMDPHQQQQQRPWTALPVTLVEPPLPPQQQQGWTALQGMLRGHQQEHETTLTFTPVVNTQAT